MMSALLATTALIGMLAQTPMPVAAINAAKNARSSVEAAQQKNADALVPPPAQTPAPAAMPGQTAASGVPPARPQPEGAYSYDPQGRRDPFVSLLNRGDAMRTPSARAAGLPGLLIGEILVKGIFKSPSGYVAIVQGADNKTYRAHAGDRVLDGSIKAISEDAIVFSQDVNDPLSTVKQREVRKTIRTEAR